MSAAPPRRRLVLLGASNLTRGFGTVVGFARARLGGPLEVLAALGHGRSYGPEPSHFLGRTLPGIASSGLWRRLAEAPAGPPAPVHAVVTDLGNDLAFGAPPERVGEWLRAALDRLEACGARPVLTELPLARLERLSPRWFAFWSRLFFPGHDLEHERVLASARALQQILREEARTRGLALVAVREDWYGADPIHYARSRERDAWGAILAPFGSEPAPPGRGVRPPQAAESWLFGIERRRIQPAARLLDGSELSLY
jgi:hypothetical protein